MSKHTLEILKLLREINDLEKTNSLLLISSMYNKNDNDIIHKNNLIILEKKALLEVINNNLKDKEKNKNNNTNLEKKQEIEINNEYPRNDINEEKETENKPSLQELNMISKKELLRMKEEKRKAKELLYSTIH
jgi:hypothetical protein